MGRPPARLRLPPRPRLRLPLAWLLATVAASVSAAPNELGRPIFREFPPGRSQIGFLCQAMTQDAAGFIYLANHTFLRYYDGATWRRFSLPPHSAGARKFARTADGTIYVAGSDALGYIRGPGDAAEFVSLLDRLPFAAPDGVELYDVLAVGNTVYFADEQNILIWRDGRFAVVPCPSPPGSHGARLHGVGETVYVTAPDRPLCRLAHDRLEPLADDPVLRENRILSVERGPGETLVLLTAARGFFQLAAGRVAPLALEANQWLAGKTILCAQRLADGGLVVAFTAPSGDGGMRFDARGRYLGPIDNSLGLYHKALRSFFSDREGGLWIGTEVGIFRLEWPSAVTVFDAINGLGAGAVTDVVRHAGVLYAATLEGVFRLVPSDAAGRIAKFERVFAHPAYSLVSHAGGLLIAGYADVWLHSAAGLVSVAKLPPGGGQLRRSQRDPARVWVTTAHGVHSLRHVSATGKTAPTGSPLWHDEGPRSASSSVEVLADSPPVDSDAVTTPDGLWRVTPAGIARVSRTGGAPQLLPHLVSATAGAVARLREEPGPDGPILWVCGANALVRVEVAQAFVPPVPFAARLTATGVRSGEQLAPRHAALSFNYVALRHQFADSPLYQTRLAGFDDAWSEWSPQRTRSFANLPSGRYRFEVRARDVAGELSAPASLAFTVAPPWWRTWWALLGYAAAGTGLVTGIVRLRTRSLHQRAERLEALVAERTAELARQNQELARLARLESEEKIAARLAEEKARLEVLRYQLNPHFLFNTLASISASLPPGRSPGRTMVERLSDFCRLTLHRADDREWTTLGDEMRLLRAYLDIERSRWGDLLDLELVCDPALEFERLPHFLLLPLVENALKYGRATSPDRVGLRLIARRDATDAALVVEVANTGAWIEPSARKNVSTLGIGLENLRERLARYYPHAHALTIAPENGWVVATLRLSLPRSA